ncbi:Ankyrin repeat domain containing protein, partial [Asbolus verrucosus]
MVKLLIECGASVNSVNKYNVTPLHLAFQFGNIEIVKLLIEKGAN